MEQPNRQLAAILFTDIVGYTAMMQQDEQNAVAVTRHYISVLKESVAAHKGKILNDYGDGSLCSFFSATEAMRCAKEIQQQLQQEPRVPLRMGLHVGEIFFEGDKVMGDGVNIASRIQSLGQANTILFSKEVFDKLKNQHEFNCVSVGRFQFKNVEELMEVFALANAGLILPDRKKMQGKLQEKKSSRKKILLTAAMVLLAIVSFFVYREYFNKAGFSNKEKSIAILPFKVNGNSDEALSEGMVEDILAHLMKIKELKVISNKSSGYYVGSKKSFKEIGEDLKVTFLMTGSVKQIGSRIRVVVQLMDSETGNLIWTDIYDRDNTQIFDLQTELATKIVNSLEAKLTSVEKINLSKHYTENIEAYNLYLRGRWFWDKRTKESYDSAESYYLRAINLDPEYALAYTGLADCYTFNQKGLAQLEAMPIAKDYTMKALSLDSNLSEALTTLGFIQSDFDYDWERAKITLKKAITLNPNYPIAHIYYGNLLQYTGESTEEGLKEIKKAFELDPLSSSVNWVLGRNYYCADRIEAAYSQLRKTITMYPKYQHARETFVYVILAKKNYSEAFQVINDLPPNWQGFFLGYAYAVKGDAESAKKELKKILKELPPQSLIGLATVYIGLKDYIRAMTLLEQAFNAREIDMYWLKVDPEFKPIRNEPRFKALLKKMNLD